MWLLSEVLNLIFSHHLDFKWLDSWCITWSQDLKVSKRTNQGWSETIMIKWWVFLACLCFKWLSGMLCMFVWVLNAFQRLLNGFSMDECVLYLTWPKWKWVFNDQLIEHYLCMNVNHLALYCTALVELGSCPPSLAYSSQKRIQSSRLMTLGHYFGILKYNHEIWWSTG